MLCNILLHAPAMPCNILCACNGVIACIVHTYSFVLRFIDQNGLEHKLSFLQSMNIDVRRSQLHLTVVGCIKALMNNTVSPRIDIADRASCAPLDCGEALMNEDCSSWYQVLV